ncbi:hypothetical protein PO909_011960 [Leuciscus waleckii]
MLMKAEWREYKLKSQQLCRGLRGRLSQPSSMSALIMSLEQCGPLNCDNIQGQQNEPELKQKQVTALCTLVSGNQTKSCLRNNRCRGALITNMQHLRRGMCRYASSQRAYRVPHLLYVSKRLCKIWLRDEAMMDTIQRRGPSNAIHFTICRTRLVRGCQSNRFSHEVNIVGGTKDMTA